MALQTGALTAFALGVANHSTLADGVHLRWTINPSGGFPPLGFDVFRRAHRAGTAQVLDFTGESERSLSARENLGDTLWTTADSITPSFRRRLTNGALATVLVPGRSALTCTFAPSDGLVRSIEIDVVQTAIPASSGATQQLSLYGVAKRKRVATGTIQMSAANYRRTATVVITGDALEGFQLCPGQFGIARVRWVLVKDEADQGWAKLNARRIGFPFTKTGYLVPHQYAPDGGAGNEDWHEASDRLVAGQKGGGALGAVPTAQFAPPQFQQVRELIKEALDGAFLRNVPATADDPQVTLDAVRATLLASLDANVARLLGLGLVDATAVAGTRYDYMVVAYWSGQPHAEMVCYDYGGDGTVTVTTPGVPSNPLSGSGVVAALRSGGRRDAPNMLTGDALSASLRALRAPARLESVRPMIERITGGASTVLTGGGSATPGGPSAPGQQTTVVSKLATPSSRVEVTVAAAGGGGTVLFVAGSTVVQSKSIVAGSDGTATVTGNGPGIDLIIVTGTTPTPVIRRICFLRFTTTPLTAEWITFFRTPGAVPALAIPPALRATVVPGFPRRGGNASEQVVALVMESQAPSLAPYDLWPWARTSLDPVHYFLTRRTDGNVQPASGSTSGVWNEMPLNGVTGYPDPILAAQLFPPAHQTPIDWPTSPQGHIDATIDGNVRYYSYRTKGRDIFGRESDWSAVTNVDAADKIAPPRPDIIAARWLDRQHPSISEDDAAVLDDAAVGDGIRMRWSWHPDRQAQAPDAAAFRVYWYSGSFTTIPAQIASVQSVNDTYVLTISFPGSGLPGVPPNAFVGDWLRQSTRQYLVRGHGAALPGAFVVSAAGMSEPEVGACTLTLRAPDPSRLDLIGNPLRPDATDPRRWGERVAEGNIGVYSDAVATMAAAGTGASVTISSVGQADPPRANVATVALTRDWRWSVDDLQACELVVGGTAYPILAGTLGSIGSLLIDTSAAAAPAAGAATLRDKLLTFAAITLGAAPAAGGTFTRVGGLALVDNQALNVLAHRVNAAGALELLVAAQANVASALEWYPDYEYLMVNRNLPVTAAVSRSSAMVGVSAHDARPYALDIRSVAAEPTAPGNEGPVTGTKIERRYRGAPAASPTMPPGVEILAPEPEQYSGISYYPWQWTIEATATAYYVYHATKDGVLAADLADRMGSRNAYAGVAAPANEAAGRAAQAALTPAQLQSVATAQISAFTEFRARPLDATDPALADPATGGLRWDVPLDGKAPATHFLRLRTADAAGNRGPMGGATMPIVVPDVRRPPAPKLRRIIEGDRALWIVWDAPDPSHSFRVLRSRFAAGSQPDARDMPAVSALLTLARAPEPVSVFGSEVQLPGAVPHALVNVYRAEEFDSAVALNAQVAVPVAGAAITAGTRTVTGLGALPDGALVYAVVQYAAGGPDALAVSKTSCAYHDTGLTAGVPYQYRIEAERQAAITAAATRSVRSFPSGVAEAEAFDARPPVPPAANAAWDMALNRVRVSWNTAGIPQGFEVALDRTVSGDDYWMPIARWSDAQLGSLNDTRARSGESWDYRLRARMGMRISANEPTIGPVPIP